MAVELVQITNPNGSTGWVSETYPGLGDDAQGAVSTPTPPPEYPVNLSPGEPGGPPEQPARNASTESWRDYATRNGLTFEQADAMSRDELVAHFTEE